MRRIIVPAVVLALVATLQGCAATDPLLNQNAWRPIGANEMNIAAEVVNPADLTHGQEATGSDGELASQAILRLHAGHVKALPDSALTDLKVQAAPSGAGGP